MPSAPRVLAIVLAVLAVAAPTAAGEPLEFGFTGLYRGDRVTVVYPTEPAEAAGTARRSAEARARFLREVHDIDAAAVPDDTIAGAALAGDLLVLGWTNRLIGEERTPPPYRRTDESLVLGDGLRFERDVDLAFVHVSPFNPERRLYFWSRIDPELDRAQLLPTEGSEWIVYRRFLPIAQGMWIRDGRWPPRRDPDAEIDHRPAIEDARARLGNVREGRYDVLHDPGTVDPTVIGEIARARNHALADAARGLGVALPDDFRVRLTVYPDDDAKLAATGVSAPVHAVPEAGELHMLVGHARNPDPHEEAHLVAREAFGPCRITALYEGVVVSAEDAYRGAGLAYVAAALVGNDRLPTIETLLDEGAIRALPADVSFPSSAFLVRWIEARAGGDAVRTLYRAGFADRDTVAAAVGLEPSEVETSFAAWVAEFATGGRAEYEARLWLDRARERQVAGDHAGVVEALREVLEIRPGEPQTLFNLASAQMRTGAYTEAERNLLRVLAVELPEDDPLRVFGHYQLGRLYDIQGERERAVREYRKVLELPDVRDSHRSAQDALLEPYTRERLE